MDADGGDGGLEIKIGSPELYDSARAKIDANLRWLFAKAYGEDHVPDELRDPFYVDQYGVEHIKPPVLELLLSAEPYSRVCAFLSLGEQSTTRHTHLSVLQVLARQSIHVLEPDGTPVTHHDLISSPIRMSSHIPLIDALMLACMNEMMSMEKVMSCLKRFSTVTPTPKELEWPCQMEEAMLLWINKVISRTREICEKEFKMKQQLMDSPCHQKVRYRRDHVSSCILPHLPVVEDLMKDLSDGTALLTIIHYYCPEYMRIEDIFLKEVLSLTDSVYNIQLLREFSNEHLHRCLYLQTEDLLYAPAVLKHNVMVYIAELFWWFEVMRPDFVKPKDLHDINEVRTMAQPKSSHSHAVSNFAKRGFLSTSPSVDSLATCVVNDTCIRYYQSLDESASVNKASATYSLHSLKQRQQNPVQDEETAVVSFLNRYVNCARNEREQNLVAIQYRGGIFYRCSQAIAPEQELLMWYEDDYGKDLGVAFDYLWKNKCSSNEVNNALLQTFSCSWCPLSYASQIYCNDHIRRSHSDQYVKQLLSKKQNLMPTRSASGQQTCSDTSVDRTHGQNNKEFYHCNCGMSFTDPDDCKTHQRLHTCESPYHCSKSEEGTDVKEDPQQCQSSVSVEKKYHCLQCGKSFNNGRNYRQHQRIHTGEKPYVCSHCGKCFRQQTHLRTHQRIHTGEKPYQCSQCGKSFNNGSNYRQHQRIHTGEKPYHCSECGKNFTSQSHLNDHERIHTGEKPYECSHCRKVFNKSSSLNRHQHIHTGKKPYHCSKCGQSFTYSVTCKRHKCSVTQPSEV